MWWCRGEQGHFLEWWIQGWDRVTSQMWECPWMYLQIFLQSMCSLKKTNVFVFFGQISQFLYSLHIWHQTQCGRQALNAPFVPLSEILIFSYQFQIKFQFNHGSFSPIIIIFHLFPTLLLLVFSRSWIEQLTCQQPASRLPFSGFQWNSESVLKCCLFIYEAK